MAKWAEILRIERPGYYAWLRKREAHEKREFYLKKKIKEVFDNSLGTYGPDRITVISQPWGAHRAKEMRKVHGVYAFAVLP